jgi:hypothetical protein
LAAPARQRTGREVNAKAVQMIDAALRFFSKNPPFQRSRNGN